MTNILQSAAVFDFWLTSLEEYASVDFTKFAFAAGPMEKTLQDFWLMVWLQRANRIVMVTKLVENFRVNVFVFRNVVV